MLILTLALQILAFLLQILALVPQILAGMLPYLAYVKKIGQLFLMSHPLSASRNFLEKPKRQKIHHQKNYFPQILLIP